MNRLLLAFVGTMVMMISCQKETSFEVGTPAIGSLQNIAGECNPMNIGGNYIAGTALNDSNFIEVTLDVQVPGSYTIYTDTVNGYFFRGTGQVMNTGPNVIKLTGMGTPLAEGTNDFFVVFDSSFCSVTITVQPTGTIPPPPGSGLHFPLTVNSWWSYDQGGNDTIKTTVGGTTTLAANTYRNFITTDEFGNSDTSYYRFHSATNNYYQYIDAEVFSALGINFNQPYLDVLFLKENVATNTTWNSDHAGTAGPLPVVLRFKFTVLNNNASLTVNGKNFTDVYQVQLIPQLGSLNVFSDLDTPSVLYYAKDIGLIRFTYDTDSENIRYWQVN